MEFIVNNRDIALPIILFLIGTLIKLAVYRIKLTELVEALQQLGYELCMLALSFFVVAILNENSALLNATSDRVGLAAYVLGYFIFFLLSYGATVIIYKHIKKLLMSEATLKAMLDCRPVTWLRISWFIGGFSLIMSLGLL